MKIYTRVGDDGSTALLGGVRVPKTHPRVVAYGNVDELNSVLGWAVATLADAVVGERLRAIQHDLFALGAYLALPEDRGGKRLSVPDLPTARVQAMEAWMDDADADLEPLRGFILPGGAPGAAALHLARTVCRRAERSVVDLAALETVDPNVLMYLNRLSDLLFVFARVENAAAGFEDVAWEQDRGAPPADAGP